MLLTAGASVSCSFCGSGFALDNKRNRGLSEATASFDPNQECDSMREAKHKSTAVSHYYSTPLTLQIFIFSHLYSYIRRVQLKSTYLHISF